ncbi:Holliday junction resolvase RecU [Enterococcus sp. LJL120]
MTIRYPNGQTPLHSGANQRKVQAKKVDFANRGMSFEEAINISNDYYLNHQIAVIHKKPTPVQIVKVDYPRRSAAVIREAYFRQPSTTDYNGVYRGRYLDFEAKETKNKTSFPFKNFHPHQIKHMEDCLAQEGICFILMSFSALNRCFFLPSEIFVAKWHQQSTERKSLTLSFLEKNGIEIHLGVAPRVPFLAAVDQYLQQRS